MRSLIVWMLFLAGIVLFLAALAGFVVGAILLSRHLRNRRK
jgi:hypothetical protein